MAFRPEHFVHPAVRSCQAPSKSKSLHHPWPRQRAFAWQTGYAGFSVSLSNLALASNYTARQEEHYRKMTYQEEVLALLGRHGIEYEPRFVFD